MSDAGSGHLAGWFVRGDGDELLDVAGVVLGSHAERKLGGNGDELVPCVDERLGGQGAVVGLRVAVARTFMLIEVVDALRLSCRERYIDKCQQVRLDGADVTQSHQLVCLLAAEADSTEQALRVVLERFEVALDLGHWLFPSTLVSSEQKHCAKITIIGLLCQTASLHLCLIATIAVIVSRNFKAGFQMRQIAPQKELYHL